jgi:general secretion pathway protein J
MSDRTSTTDSAAGFTLLELLVAMALLALVLVTLGGGIQFGARAWDVEDRRVAAGAELDTIAGLLRQLVAGAQPRPLDLAYNAPCLDGRANGMSFISPLPEALGEGGLYDVDLELRAGRLMLRWRPHLRPVPGAVPAPYAETELTRGVNALEIRYFTPASRDDPGGWRDAWNTPAVLPALVRIELRLAPGDPRHWPLMIAAPRIGSPWG